MMPDEVHDRLRDEAHRLLRSMGTPALDRFLAYWPAHGAAGTSNKAAAPAAVRRSQPLPVLSWLPRIEAAGNGFAAEFVGYLCRSAGSLDWRQSYTLDEMGPAFMRNYGWTEIVACEADADAMQISCGVLVLGPNTLYPRHCHEAEEIYLPLRGLAEWQQGDCIWRLRSPRNVIHHSSEEPHAMRTGDDPLLAMYLWLSADLRQKARLERRSAG